MSKLTPLQTRFLEHYLKSPYPDSTASYLFASPKSTQGSARSLGHRLIHKPSIQAAIKEHRSKMAEQAHISRMDVINYLADIIKTPAGHVTQDHKLAQEFLEEETRTRVKMPSKTEAIKILNQMMGWNEPEQVVHTHSVGIVIGGNV